jgi:hypothetical protein
VRYDAGMISHLMLRAAVLLTPLLALTGCTGASTGTVDPGAAEGTAVSTADKIGQFLIDNGKPVAVVAVIIIVGTFLHFLWKAPAVKILMALGVGIVIAYLALRGHR